MMPMHDPEHARRLERERRRQAERTRRIREALTDPEGDRARHEIRRPE